MSDDGALAIVVIALLGNPFSPRYALARMRSPGHSRALDHCALNVAIYGKIGSIWALRETVVRDGDRSEGAVTIGRSRVRWDQDQLVVDVDERSAPFGRRLRGIVRFTPSAMTATSLPLDASKAHHWWPVAPAGRIEADFREPALRFSGHGYHDANAGDVSLESSFTQWSWSRARLDADHTVVTYDVATRSGEQRSIALDFDSNSGASRTMDNLAAKAIGRTAWRLDRDARSDPSDAPRLLRSLEDTPFYARALVATRLASTPTIAMHETLSLDRFSRAWVRFLLGFRMSRA